MKSKNNGGFTIIELVVAMVMIAILIAVATPQTNQAFDNFQFSNGMRMLLNTMTRAKGEAMNSGLFTSVVFTTDATGRVIYTAFVDDGAGVGGVARNGVRDGSERQITSDTLPRGVSIDAENTTLPATVDDWPFTQFSSLGFPIGSDPANAAILKPYWGNIMLNKTIGNKIISQTIQLGIGGRLSIARTEKDI